MYWCMGKKNNKFDITRTTIVDAKIGPMTTKTCSIDDSSHRKSKCCLQQQKLTKEVVGIIILVPLTPGKSREGVINRYSLNS